MPLSCLFLVSALPLCHWQGVEKLVHYFSDKAWYSTISDFSYHLPHGHVLLFCFLPVCMVHVRACMHDYRHVTGGSISIFPLSIKAYLIITINLYVAQKMVVDISCVLCNSSFILDYFLFSTLQMWNIFTQGLTL